MWPFLPILLLILGFVVGFSIFLWRERSKRLPPSSSVEEVQKSEVQSKPKGRFASAIRSWIPLLSAKSKQKSEWEEALITSDMGPRLTDKLLDEMQNSADEPLQFLKSRLSQMISPAQRDDSPWLETKPYVIFMVGVNGVGKTTTVVKVAHWFLKAGLKVGVVGADTFRKAAVEQLQRGCERVGAEFFSMAGSDTSEGADPAAVVFDGLKKFGQKDLILVDTSGRLHNKKNLMEELKKMKRVSDKSIAGTPHEVWMVVDATLGQNAVAQGKSFHEAVGLTGLVLTKMDGLSRGGTIFQLFDELKVPIRFLGVGERENDLESFNFHTFIEELFDLDAPSS